jgi:hypothetical protein
VGSHRCVLACQAPDVYSPQGYFPFDRQTPSIGLLFPLSSNTPSLVIALSLIAAKAIVSTYLDGRILSPDLYSAIVCEVRTRLIDGKVPVLDQALWDAIEDGTREFESHYWDKA